MHLSCFRTNVYDFRRNNHSISNLIFAMQAPEQMRAGIARPLIIIMCKIRK